jgi:serine/threonine protein kinase
MTLTPGTKLGSYEILSLLGSGGMGQVYLAEDEKLRRKVALKVLPADLTQNEDRKKRFIQEARAAAAITHPHIAAVHDVDEVDGVTFIAMEYVRGKSLREAMEEKSLSFEQSLDMAQQVAEAMSVAHEAGVIHRDLKPENILVSEKGYAKVIDFGWRSSSSRKLKRETI